MVTIAHLLTLRVTLRDEAACAAIAPEKANAYLAAKGWTLSRTSDRFYVWDRADRQMLVPLHVRWFDYGRRMVEIVNDLAEVENRSALAVYADMASTAESD